MRAATNYLTTNWIVLTLVTGTIACITGTGTLAGLIAGLWLGWPGAVAAAASVTGGMAAAAAWLWSQITIIEEPE